jgi:hypothetical protein
LSLLGLGLNPYDCTHQDNQQKDFFHFHVYLSCEINQNHVPNAGHVTQNMHTSVDRPAFAYIFGVGADSILTVRDAVFVPISDRRRFWILIAESGSLLQDAARSAHAHEILGYHFALLQSSGRLGGLGA